MSGPTYGAKGGAFPVRPGQIWACGEHLVACGDLELGDGEKLLAWARAARGEPRLFYVDPPWSPAFVTRFRKGAGAEKKPEHTVESLVRRIARLAKPCPLFVEMGITYKPHEVLTWLSDEYGVCRVWDWSITYSGKPARLYAVTQPDGGRVSLGSEVSFEGMDDKATPGHSIDKFTTFGEVVVDLCLGLGCTSWHAAHSGRMCWGLELHPRRASCALADLQAITGSKPRMVGIL